MCIATLPAMHVPSIAPTWMNAARPLSIAHLYVARLGDRSVAYLVDVTEQKQMQAQLAQASKMQALGQLAEQRALAHGARTVQDQYRFLGKARFGDCCESPA